MKILLIDVDSKMPNLVLMKISAWHKRRGDRIFFNESCNPNKVYISCIFSQNRSLALGIANFWKSFGCEVEVGGVGIDLKSKLPYEIEHIMPDYSLYGIRYSMGFTSRGCIRRCPWCIVWRKEGYIREHAPIDEFYVSRWKKLMLLDNNFLASPRWYEKLEEIRKRKIKVCFNQGLDIRLIDQESARSLSRIHYVDNEFRVRRLYFAFDTPEIESEVIEGIKILKKHGIKSRHLMFYMLVGFNTTFEEDFHRFKILNNLGVLPFVMVYNNRKDNPILRHFARWVNRRYYKFIPWEKYDHGDSQNWIQKENEYK